MSIVTISRGSYSGGKAVAEGLAQCLGWPVYSREQVLRRAAQEYGLSDKELTESLNQPPHFWQQVINKRLVYVKCVTAVLLDLARQGNLVYHGNVGHLLFGDIPHVLRVRVLADMERRIQAAMERTKTSREQAAAQILHTDRDRGRWAQVLYGVNWDDPSQYDVVLNLERLSIAGACATIERMLQLPEFQPSEAGRQQQENMSLASRVCAAMARNPLTRAAGLEVSADNGIVVINGNVGSNKQLEAVAQIAAGVEGVKTLRCEAGLGSDWSW